MKPVLYEPKDVDFSAGGLGVMNDCRSCRVTEQANGSHQIEMTFPITTKYSKYLEEINYQVKAKPNEIDDYNVFFIYNHYKDMATGLIYVYGKPRARKLGNRVVKKVVIDNKTGSDAMKLLHDGMDLETDIVMFSDITDRGSATFEIANPLECIKGITGSLNQVYGGEIKMEPFKISLLKRRGRDKVTTFRFRKNLDGLKVEFNWDNLITRVLPYADIQNSEGKTERIFGKDVDSEFIGNYDGEVYSRYIQFTEEQGVTDLASLNKVAATYFKKLNPGCDKPSVSISMNIRKLDSTGKAKKFAEFRKIGLFDSFEIYHERFNIYIEAKVTEVVFDSLTEKVESLEAGDAKYSFFEKQQQETMEIMKKVPSKYYASDFVDYITSIISGNDGGHVIWWPKNRPTDLFFCDEPILENAKQVLRINKSGIGFSSKGWKGPFETGWTLDGVFNANFIKTGVLEGIDSHSRNENYDIYQHNGVMDFIDEVKKKKIGSVQANALRIANEDGTEAGLNIIQNEPYPLNFIVQRDNGSNERVVFIVPSGQDGKPILNIMAKTQIRNTLSVDELYVAGVKIDTNGGGSGGGTGGDGSTYSPINISSNITGNANIVAWLKKYTAEYGISEYIGLAYALIMVENGSTDGTDDIMQSSESAGYPGPGYLTGEASVKQGCKHLSDVLKSSFAKGVDVWGAMQSYNFGTAYVGWLAGKGGKNTTDLAEQYSRDVVAPSLGNTTGATYSYVNAVSQADGRTYLYVNGGNFHYAAMIRQYVKVTEGGSGDYFMPIAKPITVTSEFGWRTSPITGEQELHNGIDLVNGNPNTPIYAADAGEVVIAGMYEAWYGNYVVIKHAGGLYTGYAHQSSLKVSVGQTVTKGQQIGNMGTTGPSTGEHLHFQFFTNGPWPTTTDFINPRTKMKF